MTSNRVHSGLLARRLLEKPMIHYKLKKWEKSIFKMVEPSYSINIASRVFQFQTSWLRTQKLRLKGISFLIINNLKLKLTWDLTFPVFRVSATHCSYINGGADIPSLGDKIFN